MAELSSFGAWLRRRRKALDLTQQQLAERISCSTSALRKIEAEERRPSEQIVEQLAEVFHIAPNERGSFLKFARGNWNAGPAAILEEAAPWQISSPAEEVSQPKVQLATFLFTDIVGSIKHWEIAPAQMKLALQRHHEILKEAITSDSGNVFQIVGDAFCAVFRTALSAISAAVTAQRSLHQEPWDLPFPIQVRIGLHTGEAEYTPNDALTGGYASNPTLNRVARILNAAHGGQILLSQATEQLIKDSLPANTELRDMGEHRFKYLNRPERLFQLSIAGLPSDFPRLNTLDSARHNLTLQLTSFVGREKEMADIIHLLKKARLVTLIGPGGTGKTRLSIQVANEIVGEYPEGVWIVELAPILDPLLIPRTTAMAIGLRDEPHRPVLDMLCDYLREKKMLILLDNCEHLVEACAQMADSILRACPQIHILATSRETLGITGESLYLVPSMTLPDRQDLPAIELLSQYEAVSLFVDRATAAVPIFALTNENASSIVQICQQLDGIPLAIELAAGKIRALSPQQIAQRLDDRFHLLTGGSRTALPRHQTLQAAIDWSYNLLSTSEQILFRRLAVFVGGWTLEAAEIVCSDPDANAKAVLKTEDVLPSLIQLVNKSLITAEERDNEARYHMLETIHQYARTKLIKLDDSNELQTRHLHFFARLAEEAEPRLLGRDQLVWLNRLEDELDNIRAALDWSLKGDHTSAGLRLAGALWRFWDVGNRWSEGRERLAALLSHAETTTRTRERAKALYAAGFLAQIQHDHASASPLYAEGLAISKELQDKGATGYFLLGLARMWKRYRRDLADAKLLDESLEIFTGLGDSWGIALSLAGQATAALAQDDLASAHACLAKSVQIYRELGDKISLSFTLNELADLIMLQGNYDQAVLLYEESLALFQAMEHRRGISYSLNALGEVARCRGDYDRAKERYEESLGIGQAIGDKGRIAAAFHNLAYVSQHQGNYRQALLLFHKSLVLAQAPEDRLVIALCLVGMAGQVQEMGFPQRAANLFGAAQRWFDLSSTRFAQADQLEYQHNLKATRAQLDNATFNSAFAEGQRMSLEEALALALKTADEM